MASRWESGQKPNVPTPTSHWPGPCPKAWPGTARRNDRTGLRWRRLLVVALLAFALLVQIPAPVATPPAASPTSFAGDPVTFRTDASAAQLAAVGAQLLQDYGAFSVARGPSSILDALAAAGAYVQALPSAPYLSLATGDVDVRSLATVEAGSWPLDTGGDAIGLVHFYAPITAAWQNALAARGLSVLLYVPTDALLVRGPALALTDLRSLPYVDYVGPYEDGWKMPVGLGSAAGVQDVRIVVLPGEPTAAVEAWLAHAGVPPQPTAPAGAGLVGAYGSGDLQWVRARVPAALLPGIAALPEVEFVDPVIPVTIQDYTTNWVLQTNRSGDLRYWNADLNGSGQVIGIADTGLDYDGAQFRQSTSQIVKSGGACGADLYNCTDATRRKVVRYLDMGVLTGQVAWPGTPGVWDPYSMMDCAYDGAADGHGTAVASTLAGDAQGINNSELNNGNALAAQIYMEDIGGLNPGTTCSNGGEQLIYLPQDFADLFGPTGLVYNDPVAPVRIQSDSWGSPGNAYDVQARMVDAFIWSHPDFLVFFAAGNEGPNARTIDSPGTAKDVVTVGGACNPGVSATVCPGGQNDLASFGSQGPTADGRLKPDLVTVADGVSATSSGNALDCTMYTTANPVCVPADHGWAGTSFATPAAASAAAIIRQYFTQGWHPTRAPLAADAFDPSAALLRAMLIASGQQVTGLNTGAPTWPNNQQGFGRVLLSSILPLPGDAFDTEIADNTAGLVTGQAMTYTFHVVDNAASVRFALAWTDYPGTLGAAQALVNDLDLQVTAPNGTVYRGNHFGSFALGQSVPGGTFDTTNTEEAVFLKSPAAGDWKVQIIGANVPVGPQPFALVATGGLDPGYGRVVLDKASYSEADTVHITVYDSNASAASVTVTSGLEPSGETVALARAATGAPWTGSIATAFAQPAADGILEVRNGDTITVTYQDTNPAHAAVATASVAAVGPTVFGVAAEQIESTSAEIRWSTDLASDSEVAYGTSPASLASLVTDPLLRTSHALDLIGLQADTLYYYDVLSVDGLGHRTRDTNGGRHYTFRTAPWGDVLLVIGDDTFPAVRETSYADALAAFGWTWSTWRVSDLGLPPLSVLQARRAVIWQVGLEEYPTFNATAQGLVKAYLDGGGRLLIFSHDTSWSLGSTASPWYTAANAAWLRSVLKASFYCDPTTITSVVGVSSDPVSGAYTTGVPYTPHRSGGADDEITAYSVGGAASVAWRDGGVTGCAGGNPIGLRWVASGNNGTAGVGAWGGTPSRLEYFAWELTSLDTNATDLRPTSAIRAQILDNALRWLVGVSSTSLDRDHPAVNLTAPVGGTYAGPTIPINWTATAYGPGTTLASFLLAYSPDGGQTWTDLAPAAGDVRSMNWSVAGVLNGRDYLLRIVAADNGTPSLTGESVSNRTFAIDRPGGDLLGPVIRAGSVRVSPDPPGAAALATFNATADSSRSGGEAIAAAELFWSTTAPAGAGGTGLPMGPADGAFDGPVENVTWTGPLAVAPGPSCAWVRAEDAGGVWGPFNVTCFLVINTGPDVLPPAPAILSSVLLVNAGADLQISWAKAWDDSLYGGTARYRVWRSSAARGPYALASADIPATDAANYSFVDPGRGAGDPSNEFYRVQTIDAAGNTEMAPAVAAKAWVPVSAGVNLLGMPVDPGPGTLSTLANGLPWSVAWTYDACGGGFGWTRIDASTGATTGVSAGEGFWFNATTPGEVVVMGVAQARSSVRLCAGWNLVGLPGFAANVTVADLRAATGADRVMGFSATDPYHTQLLSDTALLAAGEGLWVHVPATATWTVAAW